MAQQLSGWNGVCGLGKETTYGTAVAPTIYLPYKSNNFSGKSKPIMNQVVKRSVGQAPLTTGTFEVGGSLDLFADSSSAFGSMLAYTLGKDTVTGSSVPYNHTFSLSSPLPSFTLSVDDYGDAVAGQVVAFPGCKINNATFSSKANENLSAKFDIVGQTAIVTTASKLTPSYSTNAFFEWDHLSTASSGVTTVNSVSYGFTSFNISIKNNLDPNFNSLSGRTLYNINEKARVVEGSFVVLADVNTFPTLNQLMYGQASGPVNAGIGTVPMTITFTQFSNSFIQFQFGAITITEVVPNRTKDSIVSCSVKFVCNESAVNADDIKIVLGNATSTALP